MLSDTIYFMKSKFLSLTVAIVAASIFFGCNSTGINTSDATNLISGPNSLKGTIAGTMLDNTSYSIPFDYHYTTNDGNSYSESWIEDAVDTPYDGDTILWIDQYFYFDRNGYDDNGDSWSPSGKFTRLRFYVDIQSMKLMPTDYWSSNPYMSGMWQTITTNGNRFVYGLTFYPYNNSGTMDITGIKYDKGSQILSGKLEMSLPNNNTQNSWYNNHNATTLTADLKIYVPKENFLVTNKGSYYGQVYRTRGK
jgi:hypothetical protein